MNTDKMTVHFLNQATCLCIVHISVDTALDRWYIWIYIYIYMPKIYPCMFNTKNQLHKLNLI